MISREPLICFCSQSYYSLANDANVIGEDYLAYVGMHMLIYVITDYANESL